MLQHLFRAWWAVLSQPSVDTFDRERPHASMESALAGLAMAGLIAGIGSAIGQFVAVGGLTAFLASDMVGLEFQSFGPGLYNQLAAALVGIVLAPVIQIAGFFVWSGILFFIAKAFGSPADFVVHSYLLALVVAPLGAVTGLLSVLPCALLLAGLPLFIYQLVLTTFALRSAHGFDTGRAIAVWLIPCALLVSFACCAIIALLWFFLPVWGAMF